MAGPLAATKWKLRQTSVTCNNIYELLQRSRVVLQCNRSGAMAKEWNIFLRKEIWQQTKTLNEDINLIVEKSNRTYTYNNPPSYVCSGIKLHPSLNSTFLHRSFHIQRTVQCDWGAPRIPDGKTLFGGLVQISRGNAGKYEKVILINMFK